MRDAGVGENSRLNSKKSGTGCSVDVVVSRVGVWDPSGLASDTGEDSTGDQGRTEESIGEELPYQISRS
jgi:hypothetical protein